MSVTISRRSIGPAGQEFNASSDFPSLSADGTYVVFSTDATNGFLGDNNGVVDIWRKSVTGALDRVSLTNQSLPTDGASFSPSISADGRYVAFASLATNLTVNDANGFPDIFRKDLDTGAVLLVSLDRSGLPGNSVSFAPAISADGRYVAFLSAATNLVDGDANGFTDTFITDLVTSRVRLVSTAADGSQASSGSISRPAISADGRYVAFDSAAANLTIADGNNRDDVFVKDLVTGAVTRASESPSGGALTGGFEGTLHPAISADGRYVVFATASGFLTGDTNGVLDVFRKDMVSGAVTLISVDGSGHPGNAESRDPSISGDGRYVTFTSLASNFAAGDMALSADVFVKDTVTGALTLLSVNQAGGAGFGQSVNAAISADGTAIAFASTAGDLVPGDGNSAQDVFVAGLGPPAGTQQGTAGNDNLLGGNNADTLLGLAGDDTLQGYDGPDRLEGGDGNDLLLGGPGNDAMIGGAGDDSYQVDSPGDQVIEVEDGGTDTVHVGVAGYSLPANVEIARLYGQADVASGGEGAEQLVANAALATLLDGGAGDDVLWGQGFADTLIGGAGDDILRGGGGHDSMVGGTGNDQAIIEQSGDVFVELPGEGIDTAYVAIDGWLLPLNVEIGRLAGTATMLLGSSGGQSLVANPLHGSTLLAGDGPDTLYGSTRADTLDGGAGDDVLYSDGGADLMRGGAGNDTYVVDDAGTVIVESSGYDTVYVTVDGLVLGAGIEVGYLAGLATRLNGSEGAESLVANPVAGGVLDGRGGDDTLYGSALGDLLAGGLGNDVLSGFGGADVFAFHIANWGQDYVLDFNPGEGDRLDFRGSGCPDFAALVQAFNGPDLAVLYGGNSVSLRGVTSLGAADCVF